MGGELPTNSTGTMGLATTLRRRRFSLARRANCEACAPGYHEDNGDCVEDVACAPNSCGGHGTCDDSSGTAVCTCDSEYTGSTCDTCAAGYVLWPQDGDTCVDDPCDPDPCDVPNGVPGTCVQIDVDLVQCDCDPPYLWAIAACTDPNACEDNDLDGYGEGAGCVGTDCDDSDTSVYDGAAELCDAKDNNCDGATDEDFPELGAVCSAGMGECQAVGAYVCSLNGAAVECDAEPVSGSPEECANMGADDDCDGVDDNIAGLGSPCATILPGVCASGTFQCVDVDQVCVPDIEPGELVEQCNDLDDDCDGNTDEEFLELGLPCDGGDSDDCPNGTWTCALDGLAVECVNENPVDVQEVCDYLDNDCDGATDEDFLELGLPCDGGDSDDCSNGTWTCALDELVVECVNEDPEDVQEVCDNLDNDCDMQTDEEFVAGGFVTFDGGPFAGDAGTVKGDPCGTGLCVGGTVICTGDGSSLTCSTLGNQMAEQCDLIDNDCDGSTDEDCG